MNWWRKRTVSAIPISRNSALTASCVTAAKGLAVTVIVDLRSPATTAARGRAYDSASKADLGKPDCRMMERSVPRRISR